MNPNYAVAFLIGGVPILLLIALMFATTARSVRYRNRRRKDEQAFRETCAQQLLKSWRMMGVELDGVYPKVDKDGNVTYCPYKLGPGGLRILVTIPEPRSER